MAQERWHIFACLALMPLPLFLPYLWLDHSFFWGNRDSLFYLNLYTSTRDALWRGEIFPHWIQKSNMGLGTLAFYSHSMFVYTITALINAPLSFLTDQQQFMVGFYASQLLGAWAMWRWLKGRYPHPIALTGALVYTLIPYKLFIIYSQYNLAQCWAIALLPLWMMAAEKLHKGRHILLYGVCCAACFYAHPLTVVSMGPIAVLYALYAGNWQWRRVIRPLLCAHATAFCLSASYLASMLAVRGWLHADAWSSGYYNGLAHLAHIDNFYGLYGPVIAGMFYFLRRQLAFAHGWVLAFWAATLLALYVLATPLSWPLWKLFPFLQLLGFPFARLQPGMAVATTVLVAAIFHARVREFAQAIIALLVLTLLLILWRVQLVYDFHPDEGFGATVVHTVKVDHVITAHMPGPLYFPVWTPLKAQDLIDRRIEFETRPRLAVVQGKSAIGMTGEGNGWLHFNADVRSQEATVRLSLFYIPAWQALSGDNRLEVKPDDNGFILLALPKGQHEVQLAITRSLPEIIGDLLTFAALAISILHIALKKYSGRYADYFAKPVITDGNHSIPAR